MSVTTRTRPPRRSRPRRGFTLAELMIVIVLLAIVGGTVTRVLAKQQRFFRSTSDLLDLRSQLRQASGAITADLRGVSAKGSDIVAITDSSIDFRQTFGSSVVCAINSGGGQIVLPPVTLASGAVLTNWMTAPVQGDSLIVLDENTTNEVVDDKWQGDSIKAISAAANTCPTGSGNLTSVSDAGSYSYALDLATNLASTVKVGAPVRFFRHAHYSLYQASDANWYLGYCTPDCATTPIQAIAGPFLPYNASGTGGLTFKYYDATGAATTTLANITRIEITIRGQTRSPVNIAGMQKKTVVDSVRLIVALRNR